MAVASKLKWVRQVDGQPELLAKVVTVLWSNKDISPTRIGLLWTAFEDFLTDIVF